MDDLKATIESIEADSIIKDLETRVIKAEEFYLNKKPIENETNTTLVSENVISDLETKIKSKEELNSELQLKNQKIELQLKEFKEKYDNAVFESEKLSECQTELEKRTDEAEALNIELQKDLRNLRESNELGLENEKIKYETLQNSLNEEKSKLDLKLKEKENLITELNNKYETAKIKWEAEIENYKTIENSQNQKIAEIETKLKTKEAEIENIKIEHNSERTGWEEEKEEISKSLIEMTQNYEDSEETIRQVEGEKEVIENELKRLHKQLEEVEKKIADESVVYSEYRELKSQMTKIELMKEHRETQNIYYRGKYEELNKTLNKINEEIEENQNKSDRCLMEVKRRLMESEKLNEKYKEKFHRDLEKMGNLKKENEKLKNENSKLKDEIKVGNYFAKDKMEIEFAINEDSNVLESRLNKLVLTILEKDREIEALKSRPYGDFIRSIELKTEVEKRELRIRDLEQVIENISTQNEHLFEANEKLSLICQKMKNIEFSKIVQKNEAHKILNIKDILKENIKLQKKIIEMEREVECYKNVNEPDFIAEIRNSIKNLMEKIDGLGDKVELYVNSKNQEIELKELWQKKYMDWMQKGAIDQFGQQIKPKDYDESIKELNEFKKENRKILTEISEMAADNGFWQNTLDQLIPKISQLKADLCLANHVNEMLRNELESYSVDVPSHKRLKL